MAVNEHDVVIVGSGHAGGMAAKVLTEKGLRCLMLNAGPAVDLSKNSVFKSANELPFRGFGRPGRNPNIFQSTEYNAEQWVDENEVPYTYDPGKRYCWVRVRLLGGRGLFWARQSFRLSDYEFDCADIDGQGTSWPIRHADLAPYYSRVEEIFRVVGRNEGWKQFPDANLYQEGGAPRGSGPRSKTMERLGAILAREGVGTSVMRTSLGRGGGQSPASSLNLLLPDAYATGKLDVIPNAIVREISIDKNTGKANGVHFVERHTRREFHVKAKVIVLAASSLESTRLLLLSNIGGSSGHLGHWLHDQVYGVRVSASVPEAQDGKAPQGLMGGSFFLPRFRNLSKETRRDWIKGYCMMLDSGGSPEPNIFADYGERLRKKLDHYRGSMVSARIYGERVPLYRNHVRLNRDVLDAWGIPVLHVDVQDSENELKQAKDAADTAEAWFKECGWEILQKTDKYYPPGRCVHEVGTARMGDDPKTSVTDRWGRLHDMPNILMADGAVFCSCGWQNVSMTILSLSMRNSEHLAEDMKKGNV